MDQNIEIIENIQSDMVKSEKKFNNTKCLNNFIKLNEDFITSVNIRGLNANFLKLQVFIESLEVKPSIILFVSKLEFLNFITFSRLKIIKFTITTVVLISVMGWLFILKTI